MCFIITLRIYELEVDPKTSTHQFAVSMQILIRIARAYTSLGKTWVICKGGKVKKRQADIQVYKFVCNVVVEYVTAN